MRRAGRLLVAAALCLSFASAARAQCVADDTADPYLALRALVLGSSRGGQPVRNTEELLRLLPDELRSNFTLIFQSRSLHGTVPIKARSSKFPRTAGAHPEVDPLHPRVVLFSGDARLILSFTGDPAGPGYDVLEVIRFCDRRAAFELSRFVLPDAAARDPALLAKARDNGASNPAECTSCHGDDPHPILDSYPVWPGFYGSAFDRLAPGTREARDYRRFLARLKTSAAGVYRGLRFPTGTPVPPYYTDPALLESPDLRLFPNTRLGMAATELNRKRIGRKLQASAAFDRYGDKLLSGLLGCEPLPVTSSDEERIRSALLVENRDRLARLGRPLGRRARQELEMTELGEVDNLARVDAVARVLGIDRADWSMAFEPDSLSLFDGILSGELGDEDFYFREDLILTLLAALGERDPRLRSYLATYSAYPGQPFGTRLDLEKAVLACPALTEKAHRVAWPPR